MEQTSRLGENDVFDLVMFTTLQADGTFVPPCSDQPLAAYAQ